MSVLAPERYAVYLITDNPSRYAGDFVENVERAVAGGVTIVQYRDKESDGRRLYERCLRLKSMLDARGVPLVVNNLPGLALAVGAAAVHVGQDDLPPEAVRRAVGRALDVGFSVRNAAEAAAVDPALVDAVGIGPVYDARGTKADAADALGLDGLRAAVRALPPGVASVAIGGVTPERAPGIYAQGVDGVSVVSAFSKSPDPGAAAAAFAAARRAAANPATP
jgi:thiamine-phosphate pyrophosphorylase